MTTNQQDFQRWFKRPLEELYKNPDAGFIILMVTLPLLERYLRQRSGVGHGELRGSTFYRELLKLFPALPDESAAMAFWEVYRHGLLHQASGKLVSKKAGNFEEVSIHNNDTWPIIAFDYGAKGKIFQVHSVMFSKHVIASIEADFVSFEAPLSPENPLSTVAV
jgi:hypothetical protein